MNSDMPTVGRAVSACSCLVQTRVHLEEGAFPISAGGNAKRAKDESTEMFGGWIEAHIHVDTLIDARWDSDAGGDT
jgi:hypothetical protein